jgi:ubiquinone/menaquinone biosynthesis C-methylase UbiE
MERILEPEVMDTWQEAVDYDTMDFTEVNTAFADATISYGPTNGIILDVGTGTARIPIIIGQKRPQWQITAIDLSVNMLKIGQQNITAAGLENQITLGLVDGKNLPYPDQYFDMVISNSIVHHLPDPMSFWQSVKRVLKPAGGLFIRDLFRPANMALTDQLVSQYAGNENERQQLLFRDSLRAAFTLEEIATMVEKVGLTDCQLTQSSDRHWTLARQYIG